MLSNEAIDNFIETNIELLDKKDFKTFYDRAQNLGARNVHRVTDILLTAHCGEEMFKHMKEVPDNFLTGSTYTDIFEDSWLIGVTKIGDHAFSRSTMKDMTIPSTVTQLGSNIFFDCNEMECCKILGQVKVIPDGMFSFMEFLKEVYLPNSIEEIEQDAFSYLGQKLTIHYAGTMEQWNQIKTADDFIATVVCTDGVIELN